MTALNNFGMFLYILSYFFLFFGVFCNPISANPTRVAFGVSCGLNKKRISFGFPKDSPLIKK